MRWISPLMTPALGLLACFLRFDCAPLWPTLLYSFLHSNYLTHDFINLFYSITDFFYFRFQSHFLFLDSPLIIAETHVVFILLG
jgi:hypothetical protein